MTFFQDHASDGTLPKYRLYFLGLPTPTAIVAGAISAGANTVTPSSMVGVAVGVPLAVVDADQTHAEVVTVTAVAPTTFTATFANAHAANWLFNGAAPLYWTDWNVDIEWNGHTWTAQPITRGPVSSQPDGASASFKIADANNVWFPILRAVNGAELALAAIFEAGFSTTNQSPVPDDVKQIFAGRVDYTSADTASGTDTIEFVLMPPLSTNVGELPDRLISTLVRTPP